eukprot:1162147-Pelagomonas_calceolata.AAC.14
MATSNAHNNAFAQRAKSIKWLEHLKGERLTSNQAGGPMDKASMDTPGTPRKWGTMRIGSYCKSSEHGTAGYAATRAIALHE